LIGFRFWETEAVTLAFLACLSISGQKTGSSAKAEEQEALAFRVDRQIHKENDWTVQDSNL